jgi:hypothetical protein
MHMITYAISSLLLGVRVSSDMTSETFNAKSQEFRPKSRGSNAGRASESNLGGGLSTAAERLTMRRVRSFTCISTSVEAID